MPPNTGDRLLMLVGFLVVGHGAYWFISGRRAEATDIRAIAVTIQIVVGVALIVVGKWMGSRSP
jgi:cytochrome bd-type quinol oxidase subunit 1